MELFWLANGNTALICNICDGKIFDTDWIDSESSDAWDLSDSMRHIVHSINEHFKKEHKQMLIKEVKND
jgi:hypothetical protein